MKQASFERDAERARRAVEDAIAKVAGQLATGETPLPALLWAVASGTVTAAAHTVALIATINPQADVAALRDALASQIRDAVGQACEMHGQPKPH